MGTKQPMLVFY